MAADLETFTDPVDRIASGYRASQILLTANRLGLFARLDQRTLSASDLAAELETDPRATRILCDALAVLGLLEKSDGRYGNSDLARQYLLPEAPRSKSSVLLHSAKLYERWGRLYDSVKSGRPVADEQIDPRLTSSPQQFSEAMADVGRISAVATCEVLDLDGARRLLDVGGGPGIYAIEFARRWPRLQVAVFDREEALEVARRQVAAAGLEKRIALLAGDAFEDELGGPYDFVFLSNVVHIYSPGDNQRLLARCAAALAPGGRLGIKDFLLDDERSEPAGGVLFAVNMLVSTEGGDCYPVREVTGWLEQVGLRFESLAEVASKSRLLIAIKG